MNFSFSTNADLKNLMLNGDVDFAVDTFKAVMMRDDWSFSSTRHNVLANIQTNTGAINYTVTASTKTFTRASGSFVTDGFVVGNYITTNGTNVGTYQISAVEALTMRVSLVGAATIADETATSKTITSNDEHTTGGGYTQGTHSTETFTIDGNVLTLDVIDLTSTGPFGTLPEVGENVIIYCDKTTAGGVVKPVVCNCRFGAWRINV